ncbi:sugar phosphate nucleotidyltransferase [Flexithrix dorotheae]|uniref:sugar phosphate nucleotidyltransferase n=1 Tax=Flexithrix dorotheae TaxID=70993 RepID=UPI0003685413|nr:NDP-sugar synthase [Flexithrix dorotheae]
MRLLVNLGVAEKDLDPITQTNPKPLLKIGEKPILEIMLTEVVKLSGYELKEISFILPEKSKGICDEIKKVAENYGNSVVFYFTDKDRGYLRNLKAAQSSFLGRILVIPFIAWFKGDFIIDGAKNNAVWVHKVEEPSKHEIIKLDVNNNIQKLVNKPKEYISDLAVCGPVYFKEGEYLQELLQYLEDKKLNDKDDVHLFDLIKKGKMQQEKFEAEILTQWQPFNGKEGLLKGMESYLMDNRHSQKIPASAKITGSIINSPVYIGENVNIENSVIGPNVSIGKNANIQSAVIQDSLILNNTAIRQTNFLNSIIGNDVDFTGKKRNLILSDKDIIKE